MIANLSRFPRASSNRSRRGGKCINGCKPTCSKISEHLSARCTIFANSAGRRKNAIDLPQGFRTTHYVRETVTGLLSQIFCSKLCGQKFYQPNRLLVPHRYDISARTYLFSRSPTRKSE